MANILDSAGIQLPCKQCGRVMKKTVGWVKRNMEFTCRCGAVIRLDADEVGREFAKIDRALAEFQRTVKKLNK